MPEEAASEPVPAYASLGGVAICCLGIELLGGAVILGGLAATVGVTTGLTYLAVAGVGGVLAALLAVGYRQFQGVTRATG